MRRIANERRVGSGLGSAQKRWRGWVGSAWEACEKCLGNAREVSGEAFLEVVGSAELSANTCGTAR